MISLSMLALAALPWLPHPLLAALGVLLVAGHNLLDPLRFAPGSAWYLPWAAFHDRDQVEAGDALRLCASYLLLPRIGVIALDCAAGNWLNGIMSATTHRRYLLVGGGGLLLGFILLCLLNNYGEKPWASGETPAITLMDFFNVTKYPPSLLFPVLTLGIDLLFLAWFERLDWNGRGKALVASDGAPIFFYLLYLYLLKLLYLLVLVIWGVNRGDYFGFSSVPTLWPYNTLLVVALYPAVHWFAGFRVWRRDIIWSKYF